MLRPTLQGRTGYNPSGYGPGLSAPFGNSSSYPGFHHGQDYFWLSAAGSQATNIPIADSRKIFPVENGVVHRIVSTGLGNGYWQQISPSTRAYYWHLSKFIAEDNVRVTVNDQIGAMGHTGTAAGSSDHLHFEIRLSPYGESNRVDPEPYFSGTAGGGVTPLPIQKEVPMFSMTNDTSGKVYVRGPFSIKWIDGYSKYGINATTMLGLMQRAQTEMITGNRDTFLPAEQEAIQFYLTSVSTPPTGALTAAQNSALMGLPAAIDDLPTNGEMGQALTSTVALVNEHADSNKQEILDAIDDVPGGSSGGSSAVYSLSIDVPAVPGTATGTATPQ